MKSILFLFLGSFITAALLSYTFKTNTMSATKAGDYTHCSSADVREISKPEAATKEFAPLHEDRNISN